MSKARTPEGQLLKAVLDYLAAKRIFAMRMNTGVLRDRTGRPVSFGVPGCADVLAFHFKGCTLLHNVIEPLWLELKAPDGKQSELQKSFQKQVEEQGHRYMPDVVLKAAELERKTMEEILEYVRIRAARKRGPKKALAGSA